MFFAKSVYYSALKIFIRQIKLLVYDVGCDISAILNNRLLSCKFFYGKSSLVYDDEPKAKDSPFY
jgi:hypothetical protein